MLTVRPRGTNDILPGEAERWQFVERTVQALCTAWHYREIRTPVFEHTELFLRGVGEVTDIVEKEMYTFEDKGQRSLTLRPEGTAPAARAYLENKLYAEPQPIKLYYIGVMFRYDRPQAGRFRQFHQFGVEVFGAKEPEADAEVIALAMEFYRILGISGLELHINTVGCPECRHAIRQSLKEYLTPRKGLLCPACRSRAERNPLRVLDCKETACADLVGDAPTPLDNACDECRRHFEGVLRYLDVAGLPYIINPRLVRGLDYYTRTAFEILASGVGAQSAVGGGGRYDGLVEVCGGPPTPGVGFALGLERTLLLLKEQRPEAGAASRLEVFVATAGETKETAMQILFRLRRLGIVSDADLTGRSLKAQMKYAGKLKARVVVIVGDEELARGAVTVRRMDTGQQEEVPLDDLAEVLKALLK